MAIVGHQKQLKILELIIQKKKLGQAYLFSGPEGVGKFSLAQQWAGRAAGLATLPHPDVYILEPEVKEVKNIIKEKDISISQIRAARQALGISPSEGYRRVLIINNAHRMNPEAQNALLKTLEEPSAATLIILVTHRKEKLLSTIISRLQEIHFGLVGHRELKQLLPAQKILPENDWLFGLGRPGWLVSKNELCQEAHRDFTRLLGAAPLEMLELAEKLSKNIPEAIEKLRFFVFFSRTEYVPVEKQPALHRTLPEKNKIFNFALETQKTIKVLSESNANARLALENLFLTLA